MFLDMILKSCKIPKSLVATTNATKVLNFRGRERYTLMTHSKVKLHGVVSLTIQIPLADLANNASKIMRIDH